MTAVLRRWDVPFADQAASTALITQPDSRLILVVAPHGLDSYPKYRVSFDRAIAYSASDESYFSPQWLLPRAGCGLAFICEDSPWMRDHAIELAETICATTIRHYIVCSGDSIVQVLGPEPTIECIGEPGRILVDFEI